MWKPVSYFGTGSAQLLENDMTDREQNFLDKVEKSLKNNGVDPETARLILEDITEEKDRVGGNLLAICWAVLVDSGFYGTANEIQTWSV